MDHTKSVLQSTVLSSASSSSSCSFWGSSILSLIYVEVIPLIPFPDHDDHNNHNDNHHAFPISSVANLTAALVKHILQQYTLQASIVCLFRNSPTTTTTTTTGQHRLCIEWKPHTDEITSHNDNMFATDETNPTSLASGYLLLQSPPQQHQVDDNDDNDKNEMIPATSVGSRAVIFLPWDGNGHDRTIQRNVPVLYLPTSNPCDLHPLPCCVTAYTSSTGRAKSQGKTSEVLVTPDTLLRVLPPQKAYITNAIEMQSNIYSYPPRSIPFQPAPDDFLHILSGDIPTYLSPETIDEIWNNHNPETIQTLTIRLKALLAQPIRIGTTPNALQQLRDQESQISAIRSAIQMYSQYKNIPLQQPLSDESPSSLHSHVDTRQKPGVGDIRWEPSLLVHSPSHGDGKTWLVQAIAQTTLNCTSVHVLSAPTLLARYGIHADAALECWLHGTILSAAVASSHPTVCIILDHLDSMVSTHGSRQSHETTNGDAAMPVLYAIGTN